MRELNFSLAFACAIVDELARSGVRRCVVSPGSRSAPLALAFAENAEIEDCSVLDERSAAFFALGLARESDEPVALVCTSGTAAANYLPAIVEAHYSGIGLIALTADRPPELRECGAGQTIDQTGLYSGYLRFYAELPVPIADDHVLRTVRALCDRACAAANGSPRGPVQLNAVFREPLAPLENPEQSAALARLSELALRGREKSPLVRVSASAPPVPTPADLDELEEKLRSEQAGWLVAGPLPENSELREAIAELSRALDWPLLAEPLSQLRCGMHDRERLVDAHDAVLRCESFADENAPRVVLRFGDMPTSKAVRLFLERHPEILQIAICPHDWPEPTALATQLVRGDPLRVSRELLRRCEPRTRKQGEFTRIWFDAGQRARGTLDRVLKQTDELSEPETVRALARTLPTGTQLICASSMPVRDVDAFWPSSGSVVRFVANRGANGIDGTLSCALGHACGSRAPSVLLIGDLALLHDVGALALARRVDVNLTVVVIDNDGGGIFEMLSVADAAKPQAYERHFGTPHGLRLSEVVSGFGVTCSEVGDAKDLETALGTALAHPGLDFLIVRTDRKRNAALHRELFESVRQALIQGT